MALTKCPECGKEVSDSANTCPNCGYPLGGAKTTNMNAASTVPSNQSVQQPVKKKNGCVSGCLVVVIIFAVVGAIILAVGTKSGSSNNAVVETTQFDKTSAEKLDQAVWERLLAVIKAQNNLMDAMNAYSEGRATELDFYNYCKDISEFAASTSLSYPKGDNENAKTYISSCKSYTLYLQMTADSLIKYIDSKATKDLSKVQENIENMQKANNIALQNRGAFLLSAGYTQEEVEKIADEAASAIEATEAQE